MSLLLDPQLLEELSLCHATVSWGYFDSYNFNRQLFWSEPDSWALSQGHATSHELLVHFKIEFKGEKKTRSFYQEALNPGTLLSLLYIHPSQRQPVKLTKQSVPLWKTSWLKSEYRPFKWNTCQRWSFLEKPGKNSNGWLQRWCQYCTSIQRTINVIIGSTNVLFVNPASNGCSCMEALQNKDMAWLCNHNESILRILKWERVEVIILPWDCWGD